MVAVEKRKLNGGCDFHMVLDLPFANKTEKSAAVSKISKLVSLGIKYIESRRTRSIRIRVLVKKSVIIYSFSGKISNKKNNLWRNKLSPIVVSGIATDDKIVLINRIIYIDNKPRKQL